MGFFDLYSSFYHTPRNPREPERLLEKLNARYEILIAPNRSIIEGKRILDLASHDGRWSFAALKSGATSVVGIEPREQLVGYAHNNLQCYGVAPDCYRFVIGDVFDVLKDQQFEIDTLFCFGFLYHTTRHIELMTLIDRVKPKHIILDSTICPQDGCVVELRTENVIGMGNAFRDATTMNDAQIVGFPSKDALKLYFTHFGYMVEQVVEYTQREFQRVVMVAVHNSQLTINN